MLFYKIKTKYAWQLSAQKLTFLKHQPRSVGVKLKGPCEMAFRVQLLETFTKEKPLGLGKES